MNKIKITIAVLLVALVGCAAPSSQSIGYTPEQMSKMGPKSSLNEPPSDEALAVADFGPVPSEDYEAQVTAAMNGLLKDPESAHYRFTAPEQGWLPRHHFDARVPNQPHRHGHVFGWIVRFGVNAKNGFGGYTGEEAYEAYFEDGDLRAILQRSEHKDIFGYRMWSVVASVPVAE